MREREQKLIDVTFQVAMMIHSSDGLKAKSREDLAEWVAEQLRQCGFDTSPCGMSWGVLK